MTDVSPLNPVTAAAARASSVQDGMNAPPGFDARTVRDMSRGLLQRLMEFDRSVRRLDGSQDAATDFANARLVLVGGVEEAIEAIDDARELGLPYANLASSVDRCRAALNNVRDSPGSIPPLPVDESIAGVDDTVLYRLNPHPGADETGVGRSTAGGSFHASQVPLPSSHGSMLELSQAREQLSRLSRERDAAAQRVSDLELRSSRRSSTPSSATSAARSYGGRNNGNQRRTTASHGTGAIEVIDPTDAENGHQVPNHPTSDVAAEGANTSPNAGLSPSNPEHENPVPQPTPRMPPPNSRHVPRARGQTQRVRNQGVPLSPEIQVLGGNSVLSQSTVHESLYSRTVPSLRQNERSRRRDRRAPPPVVPPSEPIRARTQ